MNSIVIAVAANVAVVFLGTRIVKRESAKIRLFYRTNTIRQQSFLFLLFPCHHYRFPYHVFQKQEPPNPSGSLGLFCCKVVAALFIK